MNLDYSAVNQIMSCPARWACENKLGLVSPINSAIFLGSTFHHGAAKYYEARLAGQKPTLEEYQAMFIQAFAGDEANVDRQGRKRTVNWLEPEPTIFAQGMALCEAYYPAMQGTEPMFVEYRMERKLSDDLTIFGTVDLILANGDVVDIKTSSRSLGQADLDASLQPTFYAMLLDGPVENFWFHNVIKTKLASFQKFKVSRTRTDINWLEDALHSFVKMAESGPYFPNRNSLCKWCGYQAQCFAGDIIKALNALI